MSTQSKPTPEEIVTTYLLDVGGAGRVELIDELAFFDSFNPTR
ncbi:hypothetical protein OAM92_00680 [Acidimicrobiales bacterium]|nr:hypothetical protein [Acidimicrobiales bacterium]